MLDLLSAVAKLIHQMVRVEGDQQCVRDVESGCQVAAVQDPADRSLGNSRPCCEGSLRWRTRTPQERAEGAAQVLGLHHAPKRIRTPHNGT